MGKLTVDPTQREQLKINFKNVFELLTDRKNKLYDRLGMKWFAQLTLNGDIPKRPQTFFTTQKNTPTAMQKSSSPI